MAEYRSNLPWYQKSVIYQIYPWSFKDTDGDGIGDIRGIIEKLDYLNDGTPNSLGIGAIWLSPIYPSPMRDYGYDISDYCNVDERFGSLATFDELIKTSKARDIKVIMDLVTNHTSSLHPWFIESKSSKDNPKRDWYIWHEPKPDGSAPNNWISVSGGSAWALDEKTGQYYLHSFMTQQPDLNWRNDEVKNEMVKIIEFWINRGVSGFRVDAASHFLKDKKFRNDPLNEKYIEGKNGPYDKLSHKYSANQPGVKSVIGMLCDISKQNKEIFFVSEAYLGLDEIMKFYRFCDIPAHAPFNFQLMSLPWEAEDFRNSIDAFDAALESDDVPTYVLGNHDQPRVASKRGPRQSRALALMTLTLRGTPFVYYGEEIGMEDVALSPKEMRDGFVETLGHGLSRDPARTPMQWDTSPNAGFSESKPWLPVSREYKKVNVEKQENDPFSFLNLYKTLINFRNTSPAIIQGKYNSIETKSEDVFAYTREFGDEKLIVMINFGAGEVEEPVQARNFKLICSSYMDIARDTAFSDKVTLRPFEACLYRLQ